MEPLAHPLVGQNVGNFMTDRNSSRVLAPPGGATSIVFGDASSAAAENAPSPRSKQAAPLSPAAIAGLPAGRPGPPPGALSVGSESRANNNYARPSGEEKRPSAGTLLCSVVR
jgi:SPIRAL1-like protein